ncbi:heterokaryon incompatibility protein-domain-containing protein [Xylariaceae sp. AK1471]|nr:heterokaryon incompatibility protein-domain-containing protein [Xylariaceae sp. AK1471]
MDTNIDKNLNLKSGFRHTVIDASTQIRLLRARPDGRSCIARYSLEAICLVDLCVTQYRALSYTWGKACSADICAIEVDGQPFYVRRNLHDFLVTAAAKNEHGLFFADAICINQLDAQERQLQVAKMTQVYQHANSIIAWLGLPDPVQLENVRCLAQGYGAERSSWTTAHWKGLQYLSYHPYWRRVWVVQEVLLAHSIDLWCGFFSFPVSLIAGLLPDSCGQRTVKIDEAGRPSIAGDNPWRCESPAAKIITHRTRCLIRPARDGLAQGTRVGTLEEMSRALTRPSTEVTTYQSTVMDPLHEAIRTFGNLECSDPRDKLYGFLGILNERARGRVKLDYTKDKKFAYYQTLKIGFEEIYGEEGSTVYLCPRGERVPYIAFYCDARDAFGMGDEESLRILRDVLKELRFQTQLENGFFEVQWQQQFVWRDSEIRLCPELRQILQASLSEPPVTHNWLFRFHQRQLRILRRLDSKTDSRS